MAAMKLFGDNLKRLRERAGLTQEVVAERMKLKKPTPITLMEGARKHVLPKERTIRRLAAAVQAEPWELLESVALPYDDLRRQPSDTQIVAGASRSGTTAQGAHAKSGRISQDRPLPSPQPHDPETAARLDKTRHFLARFISEALQLQDDLGVGSQPALRKNPLAGPSSPRKASSHRPHR